MTHFLQKSDIFIVGGGPAGLLAAYSARQYGKSVLCCEQKKTFASKILLSGGGRCNLTNINDPIDSQMYYEGTAFLRSAFSQFNNTDILNLLKANNIIYKVEENGRVFPLSEKAKTIQDFLINLNQRFGTQLLSNTSVEKIEAKTDGFSIHTSQGRYWSKRIILANGSPAYTKMYNGQSLLEDLDIPFRVFSPALAPISTNEAWVAKLAGLTLTHTKLILNTSANKHIQTEEGSLLFTHQGISGPCVQNISRSIGYLSEADQKNLILKLVFTNISSFDWLLSEIKRIKENQPKTKIEDLLIPYIPKSMAQIYINDILEISKTNCIELTKEEILKIASIANGLDLSPHVPSNNKKAKVARGGVLLKTVNPKTMAIKTNDRIFVCGELLDIDGKSGGYNLQSAYTTGFVAGKHAALSLE